MTWAFVLYQSTFPTPEKIDPGNDPLFTTIATIIFLVVSLGGGLLAFKFFNPSKRK